MRLLPLRHTRITPFLFTALVLLMTWTSQQAHALTVNLPWESDGTRIERKLNAIWQAIGFNDEKALAALITGSSASSFVEAERRQMGNFNVRYVECRVRNVTFDRVYRTFAFVNFDKTMKMKGGEEKTGRFFAVFRKIDGDWKLVANARTRPKRTDELEDREKQSDDKKNEQKPSAGNRQPSETQKKDKVSVSVKPLSQGTGGWTR